MFRCGSVAVDFLGFRVSREASSDRQRFVVWFILDAVLKETVSRVIPVVIMGDSTAENPHKDLAFYPTENNCCEVAPSTSTSPTGVVVSEVDTGETQNMVVEMIPMVQDEIIDAASVIPYCAVLSDGNEDSETANSEGNHQGVVAPVAGLPYSPPEIRRPFKPSNSKRQQLIAKEAAEIYLLRPKSKAGKLIPRGSMAHCKVTIN